jgi:3-oxoacyl-[acyl-carrier-protein] synthase-1
LLACLLDDIAPDIAAAKRQFGAHRVAVVLGSSTSGIAEGEAALGYYRAHGAWPADFRYAMQEPGSPAIFAARYLGLSGPAYVVATACSSGAKAFASARRLIEGGLADAAIVGGVDTLCRLTIEGFGALASLSSRACNPFSVNRDGITIGEGGAVFLMTRQKAEIALLGIGETSDAHHISAPDPEGAGARLAMSAALADAGLAALEVGYVNLHGTATPLNDAMESKAVHALFADQVPCSSTKAMTGHTLGAAGAVEAALCWLTLSAEWNRERLIPPHLWDGQADPALPRLRLSLPGGVFVANRRPVALSSSFAFGGSNCALLLAGERC